MFTCHLLPHPSKTGSFKAARCPLLYLMSWNVNLTTKWSESRSVVSNSLRPQRLYGPWNSPGLNTGVGSLSLLQGVFPIQGLNPGLPHCRWILYQLSYKGNLITPTVILSRQCPTDDDDLITFQDPQVLEGRDQPCPSPPAPPSCLHPQACGVYLALASATHDS